MTRGSPPPHPLRGTPAIVHSALLTLTHSTCNLRVIKSIHFKLSPNPCTYSSFTLVVCSMLSSLGWPFFFGLLSGLLWHARSRINSWYNNNNNLLVIFKEKSQDQEQLVCALLVFTSKNLLFLRIFFFFASQLVPHEWVGMWLGHRWLAGLYIMFTIVSENCLKTAPEEAQPIGSTIYVPHLYFGG